MDCEPGKKATPSREILWNDCDRHIDRPAAEFYPPRPDQGIVLVGRAERGCGSSRDDTNDDSVAESKGDGEVQAPSLFMHCRVGGNWCDARCLTRNVCHTTQLNPLLGLSPGLQEAPLGCTGLHVFPLHGCWTIRVAFGGAPIWRLTQRLSPECYLEEVLCCVGHWRF